MEKLTLEHLVGYLPYGLKVNHIDYDSPEPNLITTKIICLSDEYVTFDEGADFYFNDSYVEIKPILRPLSDLTKEIEHNGEKFVPIKELCKKAIDYYDFKENCFISDDIVEFSFTNNNSISAHYEDDLKFVFTYSVERFLFSLYTPQRLEYCFGANYVNKLQSWHFDIHGLIDKNLAIDINTL